MKYFAKALMQELGSFLVIAALTGIVFGIIKLTYHLVGDEYAPGTLIILFLAAGQIGIIWRRAKSAKRRDRE